MVSIIVCTYNRAVILPKCLDSLARQNYPSHQFEIIVVDNNSNDETKEVFRRIAVQYPQLTWRYFFESRQGISNARNCGVKMSEGSIVVFTDDDCTTDQNWLAFILEPFQNPSVAAVGGRIELGFACKPPEWIGPEVRRYLGEYLPKEENCYLVEKVAELPFGGNLAIKKEELIAAGGFDPKLGRCGTELFGGEETKVLMEILRTGRQIVIQPAAKVKHIVPDERINKEYFFRSRHAFIKHRLSFLHKANIYARFYYFNRYFWEACFKSLIFVIAVPFVRSSKKQFLMQRNLYSAYYKLRLSLAQLLAGRDR